MYFKESLKVWNKYVNDLKIQSNVILNKVVHAHGHFFPSKNDNFLKFLYSNKEQD